MKSDVVLLVAVALLVVAGFMSLFDDRKGEIKPVADVSSKCDYIKFDGHEYVRYADMYRAGIAHSPKCSCRTNGASVKE